MYLSGLKSMQIKCAINGGHDNILRRYVYIIAVTVFFR